jgi:hypothetical protein
VSAQGDGKCAIPNITTCPAILTNAPTEEFKPVRHWAHDFEHCKNIMLKNVDVPFAILTNSALRVSGHSLFTPAPD